MVIQRVQSNINYNKRKRINSSGEESDSEDSSLPELVENFDQSDSIDGSSDDSMVYSSKSADDIKEIKTDGIMSEISEFDMASMIKDVNGYYKHPRIAIIAKSGSGKSWLTRDILYHMQHLTRGEVICPTDAICS